MAKDSSYFTGDRDFWDDGDFDSTHEQVVYAMLWQAHGTDIAGIRQRNDRLDCVRVHLTLSEFQYTLSALATKGKITLFPSQIWIKAGIWRNLNKGNYSPKQMEGVITRLKGCSTNGLPKLIVEYYKKKYRMDIPYIYPINESGIPYPSVSVSVPVSEAESVPETESGIKSKSHCAERAIDKSSPVSEEGSDTKREYTPEDQLRRGGLKKIVDNICQWSCMEHQKNPYGIAQKILNLFMGDIPFCLLFLERKSHALKIANDSGHLLGSLTNMKYQDSDWRDIESESHRINDGTKRGGMKSIKDVIERNE